MQSFGELLGPVAEIARHARSRDEFRENALALVAAHVGTEGVAICHIARDRQLAPNWLYVVGGDAVATPFRLSYLREFSPAETAEARRPKAWRDSEVVSPRRRDRLTMYREYLPQLDARSLAGRCWDDVDGIRLFTLFPRGAVDATRFFQRAKEAIDALFPIIALGERLHSSPAQPIAAEERLADWAHDHGLTPGELKVIGLAERGLTNPEIASLLALSVNTVRNRLAVAFRKLDVSRRAELVYHLGLARESFTSPPAKAP